MRKIFSLLLVGAMFASANYSFADTTPVVLYTDITSGPNTGGENNNGIYLSIFGRNFGADPAAARVFINDAEVAAYKYFGPSLGRPDVQQITVQPGAGTTSGSIKVIVNGMESNATQHFTVRPGNIFFVAQNGNDAAGEIGNSAAPFRTAQATFDSPAFVPGDFIVMRGGTWTDLGRFATFMSFAEKSGTAEQPLTVMAYPGEKVLLDTKGRRGGINFYNTSGGAVISGLVINGNGHDLLQLQNRTNNIRLVNNELFGLHGSKGGSAAITGNGWNWNILGNSVHDNGYSRLFHGIYIDNDNGDGSDNIEVAYNHIYNQTGGRAIQVYWDKPGMTNIALHDNLIHDIDRDGIVISNNAGDGIAIYNNIIYRTGRVDGAGIRVNSNIAHVKVLNNTLYDAAVAKRKGAIFLEDAGSVELTNNIIFAVNGQKYLTNNVNSAKTAFAGNLWFGAGAPPALDVQPFDQDPLFVNPAAFDFHLQPNSPASNVGRDVSATLVTDFDGVIRNADGLYDLGALEHSGF